MLEYYKLYSNILDNINRYSNRDLKKALINLEVTYLASTLKVRFKDNRSIKELSQLIISEYNLG